MWLKRLKQLKNKNLLKRRPHLAPLYEQVLNRIKQKPSFLATLHRLDFWWLATYYDTLTVRGNCSIGPIKKPVQEYEQIDRSTYLLIVNNYFVALASVKADPGTFAVIGNGLRDKFKIALAAVEGDGTLLRCVGYEMRRNKRVIEAAIKQNPAAEQFAVRYTRHDWLLAVRHDGDASPDRESRSRSVSPARQPLKRVRSTKDTQGANEVAE